MPKLKDTTDEKLVSYLEESIGIVNDCILALVENRCKVVICIDGNGLVRITSIYKNLKPEQR